jgi:hypothetical protein
MVRTFLKHSDEAVEDEELCDVHRALYDVMLSLGGPLHAGDAQAYLKQARKKTARLRRAVDLFVEIQQEAYSHMNFQMASRSLSAAVGEIEQLLAEDAA